MDSSSTVRGDAQCVWAQMPVGASGSLWKLPLIVFIFSMKQEARSMAENGGKRNGMNLSPRKMRERMD